MQFLKVLVNGKLLYFSRDRYDKIHFTKAIKGLKLKKFCKNREYIMKCRGIKKYIYISNMINFLKIR